MTAPVREHSTRPPTGKAPWPILLLAGAEKAGKSWAAAQAAASPRIGRTFWVTFGEDEPDEYGQLATFEIVDHDGTYRDFLDALRWVNAQPLPEQGAPLLVVDSMTRLWDLLSAQAQESAWTKAREKAEKAKRPLADEDPTVTVELWNTARKRWDRVIDELRAFRGPVVITARLDQTAVIGPNGSPTGAKVAKVKAHSSLPFDVGGTVEMPTRGEAFLVGMRSVAVPLPKRKPLSADWSVDGLWAMLGVDATTVGARDHAGIRVEHDLDAVDQGSRLQQERQQQPPQQQRPSQPKAATPPRDWDPVPWEDAAAQAGDLDRLRMVYADAEAKHVLDFPISSGTPLKAFLRSIKAQMLARQEQDAAAEAAA